MLTQESLGPFDVACLDRIEDCQMFTAGLLDALGRQFLEAGGLLHAPQAVLLANGIDQETVA